MARQTFYADRGTELTAREKNLFLGNLLTDGLSEVEIKRIDRVDEADRHGWVVTEGNGDDKGY